VSHLILLWVGIGDCIVVGAVRHRLASSHVGPSRTLRNDWVTNSCSNRNTSIP